ncbi:MAG: hypothetical protein AAGA29_03340, partial [Planctomycetota bacterium]
MSVISVKEKHQDRRAMRTRSGSKEYTRVFQVETDDINDGPAVAVDAAGVPASGDTYNGVMFSEKDAAPVDGDDTLFEVTVSYSNSGGSQAQDEDPLARPADVSFEGSETTEPFFRDVNDKRVINSAGEPFHDFLDRIRSIGSILIERNEATFDDVLMESFRDTTNDATVTIKGNGYAAGTLKMGAVTAKERTENDVTYWRVRYPISKNRDGWLIRVEDRGFSERLGNDLKPILDAAGNQVALPWPLNGAGTKRFNPADLPAIIDFDAYESKSWAPLGLPA